MSQPTSSREAESSEGRDRPRLVTAGLAAAWTATVAYGASVSVGLHLGLPGSFWNHWVYDGVIGASAALCLVRGFRGKQRSAWFLIGCALSFYWLGDLYWNNALAQLAEPPYPSWADAGWLAYYPPAYLGVGLLVRSRARGVTLAAWLDGVVGALALASVAAMFVFDPIVASTHGTLSTVATNLAYPTFDVLLLALTGGGVVMLGRRAGPQLVLLTGALVIFAVVDSLYLVEAANNTYNEGGFFNLGWPLASVLMASAGWIPERSSPEPHESTGGWSDYIMLAIFTAVVVGVLGAQLVFKAPVVAQVTVTLAVLTVVARLAVTIRERSLLAHSREEAHTDDLTGLHNRRHLYEAVDEVLAQGRSLAILLIDLDRFKEVNDTLGHNVGDELLCKVAERFAAAVPVTGQLARIGGDEFVVLLPEIEDEQQAVTAAMALIDSLDSPFLLDGLTVPVQASIGIGLVPGHARTRAAVLRCADVAMYRAKAKRTQIESYIPDNDEHSRDYLTLVSELRLAVGTGQIVLHYQPKQAIADGRVAGVEALARWQHPRLGLLAPNRFIPVAEREGIMRDLTLEILDGALAQQAAWREEGLILSVAVNLSPVSLLDTRLPQAIDEALHRHGSDPSMLELEITEETLMQDPKRALDVIARISELGVGFSLDDFGTGYSSLAQLKNMPVRAIKIDRSFISTMNESQEDANIVRSTVQLGHSLNLEVIAEGIETPEHLHKLREYGCDIAQGFLLARPMPAADIPSWIAAGRGAQATSSETRSQGSSRREHA